MKKNIKKALAAVFLCGSLLGSLTGCEARKKIGGTTVVVISKSWHAAGHHGSWYKEGSYYYADDSTAACTWKVWKDSKGNWHYTKYEDWY